MRLLAKITSFCIALSITTSLISMSSLAISETCSHGNRTFNDMQLSGGVGQYGQYRRYYWISSNVDSSYTTPILNAFSNWVDTSSNPGVTTSISIYNTSSQSSSSIDIYKQSFSGNTTGMTEFWLYSDEVTDPSSQNWGWNKILINCSLTSSYSTSKKTGLVAHELGHAMGLSHQPKNPSSSIMYNYDDNRALSRPGTVDCNNINHIYG